MRGDARHSPIERVTEIEKALEESVLTPDEAANLLLYKDAMTQGVGYGAYCKEHGIVGPAQERQIRRHEVPLEEGR